MCRNTVMTQPKPTKYIPKLPIHRGTKEVS